MLTAKRLLEENAEPSDEEIAEALGGNLCRCGSYVKIIDAVRAPAAAEIREERAMKVVTYATEQGPRVGVLDGDAVVDAGFDGDMVAFIEAGAPVAAAGDAGRRTRGCSPRCARARCATSSPSRAT